MVPNERFNELLKDIEPSASTKAMLSSAHKSVREHLRNHPLFCTRWLDGFLAGSYSRDTAIRPKKTEDGIERPDVDIILETNFNVTDSPDVVLGEVSGALLDKFKVERINKRSVRINTASTEIDLVPVIAYGTAYMIPDREINGWKETNPPVHNSWSQTQNENFGGRFKPLVKLFKWWRRENNSGKRPKGFVLEVLAARHAPLNELHYGEAFANMLQMIYNEYASSAKVGVKPHIDDPAVLGNDILSKVSITDWKNFINRVGTHAGCARRAQNVTDPEEATRLWRKLFGDRFKVSMNSVTAANLSQTATLPPAGTVGYSFPDVPATPKKPRGFA